MSPPPLSSSQDAPELTVTAVSAAGMSSARGSARTHAAHDRVLRRSVTGHLSPCVHNSWVFGRGAQGPVHKHCMLSVVRSLRPEHGLTDFAQHMNVHAVCRMLHPQT